jgi:hypothetical protein
MDSEALALVGYSALAVQEAKGISDASDTLLAEASRQWCLSRCRDCQCKPSDMGLLKLNSSASAGGTAVNGREYFRNAAKELGISALDPVEIQKTGESIELKSGRRESRVGGRIARNIKHLNPEETADRRRRSERFLKQPDMNFPAEEEKRAPGKRN